MLDRGFIFGDGVHEYVPVINGRPYRLDGHLTCPGQFLQRRSDQEPHSNAQWTELVLEAARRNGPGRSGGVYWQITARCSQARPQLSKDVEPTVFMMSNPLPKLMQEQIDNGVPCYTFPTSRWHRAAISKAFRCSAMCSRQHATEHGGAEVVMIRDGFMTEALGIQRVCVFGDTIIVSAQGTTTSSAASRWTAYSISRKARTGNSPCAQCPPRWAADELWLSSSSRGAGDHRSTTRVGNAAHKGASRGQCSRKCSR